MKAFAVNWLSILTSNTTEMKDNDICGKSTFVTPPDLAFQLHFGFETRFEERSSLKNATT